MKDSLSVFVHCLIVRLHCIISSFEIIYLHFNYIKKVRYLPTPALFK